jgi:hypothetical protein
MANSVTAYIIATYKGLTLVISRLMLVYTNFALAITNVRPTN